MSLSKLLQMSLIHPYSLEKDCIVTGLALDSREAKPGDLFFACIGVGFDGRNFIPDAVKKGVSAILVENSTDFILEKISHDIPVIFVENLSQKYGFIAANFFDHPSKKMSVVGITGTNGKTSCSHFIASALHHLQLRCGVIGTLGNGLYGNIQPGNFTTPDAVTLQKTLASFVEQKAQYTSMEVSSHSLDQGRVNGTEFTVGVFTNLTRDHLDYHGTMECYGDTKKKLFTSDATKNSIINIDDPFGKRIVTDLQAMNKSFFSYGTEKSAMIYADNLQLDLSGMRINIHSPWGNGELHAGLIGKFNVGNLLAVFTTLCVLDIPFDTVRELIAKLKPVDGRMQTLGGANKPLVVVDYSHTPDALEKALIALRHHCDGMLYCIFGCGGDRDRGKRPLMAQIAEEYADVVMVTDDNPRTEDPEQIFTDIVSGFTDPLRVTFQHNRAMAIRETLATAKAGDCILIAGKGAETYQIIGTEKFPFSDIEQVNQSL